MNPSLESRFKTPESAAEYVTAYNAALALWTMPREALDITTSFGTTHINVSGSPDSPPLILIHGAQMSSTVWYPNVEPLTRHFRAYALDVVDQSGLSVPTSKLKTAEDCAKWLTEVLDGLKLERVTLMGHSQGCWLSLNLALRTPQRVERLVLLSPAPPFVQVRWQVLLKMLPVFIRPTKSAFYRYFQSMTTLPLDVNKPHPLVEQFVTGALSYKPQELSLGMSTLFSDDDLRRINQPALLLIGDHEVMTDPKRVLERARRLMPHIEAEMIANAGHLMPVDQADATNTRILEFLID